MVKLHDSRPTQISRRNFVRNTMAVAVGGTALSVSNLASAGSSDKIRCKTPGCEYDVIVIGGGFSGVAAARDCQENGLKTLLLEARNRLGGRTFTSEFEGTPVELGGTWIHNTQPFVWAEAQRYGLEIKETPGAVPDVMQIVMQDGSRTNLTLEQIMEVATGWETYCSAAREIIPRPYDLLHNRDAALAADQVGAVEHLDSLKLTPLQYGFNKALISLIASDQANKISYLEILRFHLLGGGYFPTFMDATTRFQLKDGTGKLIDAMFEDAGAELRLATPIKSIQDLGDKVIVTTTRGEKLTCGAVISSIPMNTIGTIDFQPPLPAAVVEAGKQRHPGRGLKFYMKVAGDVGTIATLAPHLPLCYAMTYKRGKDYTILVGFSAGADRLDAYDDEDVQAALRDHLPDAEVMSVMHYDWNNDPYSGGTWATYRPGWVGKYYDQFQKDSGRTFFASGDHGEGWRGTIDGAIGAGIKAAQNVKTFIG